jgi:hypothetical protein
MTKSMWCATRKLKFHLKISEKLVIDKPKMTTPKTNELSDFRALLNIHVFHFLQHFTFLFVLIPPMRRVTKKIKFNFLVQQEIFHHS